MNAILTSKWTKVVVFLLCLVPLGCFVWRGFQSDLTANPVQYIDAHHRRLDAALSGDHSGHHSAPKNSAPAAADSFPAHARAFRVFLCLPPLHAPGLPSTNSSTGTKCGSDVAKRPFITVGLPAFCC